MLLLARVQLAGKQKNAENNIQNNKLFSKMLLLTLVQMAGIYKKYAYRVLAPTYLFKKAVANTRLIGLAQQKLCRPCDSNENITLKMAVDNTHSTAWAT